MNARFIIASGIITVLLSGCKDNLPFYSKTDMMSGVTIALKCQRMERDDFSFNDCVDQSISAELITRYGGRE